MGWRVRGQRMERFSEAIWMSLSEEDCRSSSSAAVAVERALRFPLRFPPRMGALPLAFEEEEEAGFVVGCGDWNQVPEWGNGGASSPGFCASWSTFRKEM